MSPVKIAGANVVLNTVRDCDTAGSECTALAVLLSGEKGEQPMMQSAWMPSLAELNLLKAGHPVVLTFWSRQHPPVALGVELRPAGLFEVETSRGDNT